MSKHTHDELEPIRRGMIVHVCEGPYKCRDGYVTDSRSETVSKLEIDKIARVYDRAGAYDNGIPGTWHYADHGDWREVGG